MQARLVKTPGDPRAAVTLADALLRQTRVTGNAGLAARAEAALKEILKRDPEQYDARRMLAATYLSQHRFHEALAQAEACRQVHRDDAWLEGAIGDAHLELGEYAEAFDAFDRMVTLKPNAASYARASYARELQGDLPGALKLMQMAAEATGPQDPESLAWHYAQLGHLNLELGRVDAAEREFRHAEYAFPNHPFARAGLARVAMTRGQYAEALAILAVPDGQLPVAADLALTGDLLTALGRADEAERTYRLAEAAWQSDAPEPSRLARFLAERGRRPADAVRIAEQAAATRHDIFTDDALAWAYFQTGQIDRARAAIAQALRTGSRDRIIRYHAAAIAQAAGDLPAARMFVAEALDGALRFDLIAAPAALALRHALNP
jgi:tetratricopeptide (TPR) repeat protein